MGVSMGPGAMQLTRIAERCQLASQGTGQVVQCRLCHPVHRLPHAVQGARGRADVHHGPHAGLAQGRQCCLDQEERCPDVGGDVLVEPVGVPFAERLVAHHRGIVDQPVDPAVGVNAGRHDVLRAGAVGQVGRHAQGLPAAGTGPSPRPPPGAPGAARPATTDAPASPSAAAVAAPMPLPAPVTMTAAPLSPGSGGICPGGTCAAGSGCAGIRPPGARIDDFRSCAHSSSA